MNLIDISDVNKKNALDEMEMRRFLSVKAPSNIVTSNWNPTFKSKR
jgi:hypothetical protein